MAAQAPPADLFTEQIARKWPLKSLSFSIQPEVISAAVVGEVSNGFANFA